MGKRLTLIGMALVAALGFVRPVSAELVGYWSFDEGSGTIAKDGSGNGNDGTLVNGPAWTDGKFGYALQFDGTNDYVNIGQPDKLSITGDLSFSMWLKISAYPTNWRNMLSKLTDDQHVEFNFRYKNSTQGQFYYGSGSAAVLLNWNPSEDLPLDTWTHVAGVRKGRAYQKLYFNGGEKRTANITADAVSTAANVAIGRQSNNSNYFSGMIDEVALWTEVLGEAEIRSAMAGLGDKKLASKPNPADKATDVPREAVLNWTPGESANTHDVYLGTVLDDVSGATRSAPRGVLASRDQSVTTCDPGHLDFGQTYYWRVDEVNAAPDFAVFKGNVWRFTVEPYAYPVKPVAATASSVNAADMGPEKTIDGSGLASDRHGTVAADMWLSAQGAGPAWIQYTFDQVYKLDEMLVWNSNQPLEAVLGLGAKAVTIEYSADGSTWKTLGDFEFARAPGTAACTADTKVDFAGAMAEYVKLTIQSNWGNVLQQYGLSEVRFFIIPMVARAPSPNAGTIGMDPQVTLSWRPGREAAAHQVFLGTDPNNLVLAATVATPSYQADLSLGQTYYWRVDEVNEAETPAAWPGAVWSFSTQKYLVVDDFESYTDKDGEAIFQTWPDGFDSPTNGSQVGNLDPPYAEQTIVQGGKQAMSLTYSNTAGATYSETERTFATPQDWTKYGCKTLSVPFFADPNNTGQMYLKINNTKIPYNGKAEDLKRAVWQAWNIDLATSGANVKSVSKIALGIDGAGAAGILRFDNIALYPTAGAMITPADPGTMGLLAWYKLDGDAQDAAGSHHGTLNGAPQPFAAGKFGQALHVTDDQTFILVPYAADLALNTFSVSVWVNLADLAAIRGIVGTRIKGNFTFDLKATSTMVRGDIGNGTAWLNSASDIPASRGGVLTTGVWHHLVYVVDNAAQNVRMYLDGAPAATAAFTVKGTPLFMTPAVSLGIGSCYDGAVERMRGLIDDVRLYNRALSDAEAAALAGRTDPFAQPF